VDATRTVGACLVVVHALSEPVAAGVYEPLSFRRVPGSLTLVQKVADIAAAWNDSPPPRIRGVLVSDLRHFLDLPHDVPAPAGRLAEQLANIVCAATAGEDDAAWISALPCRRRPGHRRCPGRIRVRRGDAVTPIVWECTACSDEGSVSGWQDTLYDLRDAGVGTAVAAQDVVVSDDVAASLRGMLLLDRDCQRIVYGARVEGGRIVLTATDEQLEELGDALAAETNHEDDQRRRRRLDAAFDELSGAVAPTAAPVKQTDTRRDAPAERPASTPPVSGLPELEVARVQRWCTTRVPERARHQVRVECEVASGHLTIVERRAPWREKAAPEGSSLPIARLRYAKTTKTWTLYSRDHNLRFHRYDRLPASPHVEDLLTELDRDPTGVFWG